MKKQKTKNKMIDLCPRISIITLNANDLNTVIKKQRFAAWIKKHHSRIYCLHKHTYKHPFKCDDIARLKIIGWKKYYVNINQEKAGVTSMK